MQRVIVETPYAGDVDRNIEYGRACVRDCLKRGEAPIASHLLYTQPGILDDDDGDERRAGIAAGLAWVGVADIVAVYADLGISPGMREGIARAEEEGRDTVFRSIVDWHSEPEPRDETS